MTQYITIKRLSSRRSSMFQTSWCISPAPVMPCVLLSEALRHELVKRLDIDIKPTGIGIIHHHATPWVEKLPQTTGNRFTYAMRMTRGAYPFDDKNTPASRSSQPEPFCDYCISLIIETAIDTNLDSESLIKDIRQQLLSMRLAGGVIDDTKEFRITIEPDLQTALKTINTGFWIKDVTNKFSENLATYEPVESLIAATNSEPWIVPANLGYAMLTSFEHRTGARDAPPNHTPAPHAFAEPMIGLVQFLGLRKLLAFTDQMKKTSERIVAETTTGNKLETEDYFASLIEDGTVTPATTSPTELTLWKPKWINESFIISTNSI